MSTKRYWLAAHDADSYAIGIGDREIAIFAAADRDHAAFMVECCNTRLIEDSAKVPKPA